MKQKTTKKKNNKRIEIDRRTESLNQKQANRARDRKRKKGHQVREGEREQTHAPIPKRKDQNRICISLYPPHGSSTCRGIYFGFFFLSKRMFNRNSL